MSEGIVPFLVWFKLETWTFLNGDGDPCFASEREGEESKTSGKEVMIEKGGR